MELGIRLVLLRQLKCKSAQKKSTAVEILIALVIDELCPVVCRNPIYNKLLVQNFEDEQCFFDLKI